MTTPNQPVTHEELAAAFTKLADGKGMDLRQRMREVAAKREQIAAWEAEMVERTQRMLTPTAAARGKEQV